MATVNEETISSELLNGLPVDTPPVAGETRDVSTLVIADEVDTKASIVSAPISASGDNSTKTASPKVNQPINLRRWKDPVATERANLVHVLRLVIKELIDSSLGHGRSLESDHQPLQHFFVVLEHVFLHGVKVGIIPVKKGLLPLRDRRDFWPALEQLEKVMPEAVSITTSVREMPLKSAMGRGRAWIRLAMMQKQLANYFQVLVSRQDLLQHHYEAGALILDEEASVIAGLLVGLNIIDCNIVLKDEDLEQPMGVIDYSLYMKDIRQNAEPAPEDEAPPPPPDPSSLQAVLDQKNYLEEINLHLTATVTNLQQKVEGLQTANILMREDLATSKNSVLDLQQEISRLQHARDMQLDQHQRMLQLARDDIETERQTYNVSRTGLDVKCQEWEKMFLDEVKLKEAVQKEVEVERHRREEMEMALKLVEKDVHEKQDVIVMLRKLLEDVKTINIDIYAKLQESEGAVKHKSELIAKLEEKTNQMSNVMCDMENVAKQSQTERQAMDESIRKLNQIVIDKDNKKSAVETDLKIEREWRASLQKSLEQEKEKVAKMEGEMQAFRELKQEHDALQRRHLQMQKHCEDQERALAELGSHLSESKMRVEDMREIRDAIREAHWVDEALVNNCRQCQRPFTISRRKHHCRGCGDVFCAECSDNRVLLPSSAKPVRVCNTCNTAQSRH